jgi:hypothetical protein
MQIISNRQVLFELTKYNPEVVDGKETGRSVAHVEKKILVAGDVRPQVVPDWVKEDPHYEMLVDDGQIIEVTAKTRPAKPSSKLKGANLEAETPKAKFADEGEGEVKEDKPADETGWGAKA